LITETFLQPTIKQRTFLISKIARRKGLRAPEQVTAEHCHAGKTIQLTSFSQTSEQTLAAYSSTLN
jgi:hypothetical protein